MNRSFFTMGAVVFAFALTVAVSGQVKVKKPIFPPGASTAGPYSPAIVANGFVFVSGQIGLDPKTGLAQGFDAQLEQVITNLETVLKAAGSGLDNVVKTTVFLADMNDFDKLNQIYTSRFKAPMPARSTLQVARLPRDARVEIEAIALTGDK